MLIDECLFIRSTKSPSRIVPTSVYESPELSDSTTHVTLHCYLTIKSLHLLFMCLLILLIITCLGYSRFSLSSLLRAHCVAACGIYSLTLVVRWCWCWCCCGCPIEKVRIWKWMEFEWVHLLIKTFLIANTNANSHSHDGYCSYFEISLHLRLSCWNDH